MHLDRDRPRNLNKAKLLQIRIKNVVLNILLYSKGRNGFTLQLHDATPWGAHFALLKRLATGHGFRLDCRPK